MERESKEPRDLEANCSGGQGPPRAVAPSGGGRLQRRFDLKYGRFKIFGGDADVIVRTIMGC